MLSKFRKDSRKTVISPKEPQPQGRGMTPRTDMIFGKKLAGEAKPEQPALRTDAGSLDGYHSAKEASDFHDDTEEILKRMDMSYNASVDFLDLNAQLCGLKQGTFESPKDYYDHMVDI